MARLPNGDGHPVNDPLKRLIDLWCDRRDLRALAMILPAYTSNAGLTDDWARVLDALYGLRASRALPPAEHAEIERLVPIVETMIFRR